MTALAELDRMILLCRDHVAPTLSDEQICQHFQSLNVLCVSDLHSLSSHSGQTCLFTLVALLSRMGMQVGLNLPDAAVLLPQPPFLGSSLCEALLASSRKLVTAATVRRDSNFKADLIFVVGDLPAEPHGAPCWYLTGCDWLGSVAMRGVAKPEPWSARLPVGAMVSAALAAGEAFKSVMRSLPLRNPSDGVFFEPSGSSSWNFDPIAVPLGKPIDLGSVDFISAGAISQAALFTINRFPSVEVSGRIFDADITDATNLNRNMLTLTSDVGQPKVLIASRQCGAGVHLQPIVGRFPGQVSDTRLARRVVVGVDDIPSRWKVQESAPSWVAVSGTSHYNVSSSVHSPGSPCSGCLHPLDDDGGGGHIPTVSFVSFWAGLAMTVRLLRDALGQPYPPERQHLWLTPLRMDLPHAAMWMAVAPRRDCPVHCLASVSII
jgi:hypothetical protein